MPQNILDTKEIYQQFDPENLRQHWENFPAELLRAEERAAGWDLDLRGEKIGAAVVCGMGGSGIAGLIAQATGYKHFKIPITVINGYDLPAWVDEKTLVIAISYSGETEETLSCVAQAQKHGCQIAAVTKGGQLAVLAQKNQWPLFEIDYTAPPRAALAHLLAPLMRILNLLQKDFTCDWKKLATDLEKINLNYTIDRPTADNPAKQLAQFCHNKKITIIAGQHLTAAAVRFKNQINENAKHWAACEFLPELSHNFTASLDFPIDTRISTGLVIMSSGQYHPRLLPRLTWLREYLETAGWSYYEFPATTGHPDAFGEVLETILLGDWASYYLAMLNQVNPTPVKAINDSKQYLHTTYPLATK